MTKLRPITAKEFRSVIKQLEKKPLDPDISTHVLPHMLSGVHKPCKVKKQKS